MNTRTLTKKWSSLWRLKWMPQDGTILFRDLKTVAKIWRLTPLNGDDISDQDLDGLYEGILRALDSIPRESSPWILQIYLSESGGEEIRDLLHQEYLAARVASQCRHAHQWEKRQYLHAMKMRRGMAQPQPKKLWRLRHFHIVVILYQDLAKVTPTLDQGSVSQLGKLDRVSRDFTTSLSQLGFKLTSMSVGDTEYWLGQFLGASDLGTVKKSAKTSAGNRRFSFDAIYGKRSPDMAHRALGERVAQPSREIEGAWDIDQKLYGYLSVDRLLKAPQSRGLLLPIPSVTGSLERSALWNDLPSGLTWSMTIAFESRDLLLQKIRSVKGNAKGAGSLTTQCLSDCDYAEDALLSGSPLYSVNAGLYLVAANATSYEFGMAQAMATFSELGVAFTPPALETYALEAWLQNLPGNFVFAHDRRPYLRRVRLWYGDHVVRLAPFFSEKRGADKGAIRLLSRSGEIFRADPLAPHGRVQNGHTLILGPTGSGKTALAIQNLLQLCAQHRPRLFLISTLPTFELLGQWLKSCSWTVQHIHLGSKSESRLPPFGQNKKEIAADQMGTIELLAGLMARPDVDDPLQAWEKDALREAVITAHSQTSGTIGPSVSQVVKVIEKTFSDTSRPEQHRVRMHEMAASMRRFTRGIAGEIFDHPGQEWDTADCTILNLGVAARRGNEHMRALAYATLIVRIHDLIEHDPLSDRPTLVVTDEAHNILQHPALAPFLSSLTAQWRTWGASKWIITQSLRQFPEATKDLLALSEWWWVLGLERDEIEQVVSFKNLSVHNKQRLQSLEKVAGFYTECALISRKHGVAINRVIPPPLAMALAQTELHEKVYRAKLCQEKGYTNELQACHHIAREIAKNRNHI